MIFKNIKKHDDDQKIEDIYLLTLKQLARLFGSFLITLKIDELDKFYLQPGKHFYSDKRKLINYY